MTIQTATAKLPDAHAGILHYAADRGLTNGRLAFSPAYGWALHGSGGHIPDGSLLEWPLVWAICDELGIGFGCGGVDYKQCRPERF